MSPEEARTRWCPMAKTAGGANRWSDKDHALPVTCMCIADDCAVWQWSVTPKGAAKQEGMKPDGYCGLMRP